MALFINEEGDKQLVKKQVKVPDKLVAKLTLTKNLLGNNKQSKGFKRISAIVDDDYNKRSDNKDKIHNGDKTVSFTDLKRIDFDMRHMSPSKTNLEYVIQGGDDMKNWAHDMLRKMRTAVKKVKEVPEVPKIDKSEIKPDKPQKDIKIGKATLKITEGKKPKKVIIDENKLLLLKEYHNQTVFNFDDEGNAYFKKDNYQHFIDFLEEIGKYGQLPPSGLDKDDVLKMVDDNKAGAAESCDYNDNIDIYEMEEALNDFILDACDVEENRYFNRDETWNMIKRYAAYYMSLRQNGHTAHIIEFLETIFNTRIEDISEICAMLNYEGKELLRDKIHEYFLNNIDDYGFPDELIVNDRGLIYVERAITMPNFNSPDFSNYDDSSNDYYQHLMGSYTGIGNFFSWKQGGAVAYWAKGYGANTTTIIIKGWINPNDVDWEETIVRNCYSLRDEKELYAASGNIEIDAVVIKSYENKTINGINLLQKPIIVSI